MRKLNTLFLACALLVSLAIVAVGNEPFVLEELHLIHWEDVADGRPSYTGPVSAAILMAWYAEHGYPELLPDLNGDGRINEQDTLMLAGDFGEEMGGNLVHEQLADPFIVYPLARYIGERYPNEFRMLIYDESFPEEVEHDLGQPFNPTEVGGIVLEVHEDPFYELYVHHLEEQRPGIVGIGPDFPEWNHFAVSRSFVPQEEPEGFPVDLVSTSYQLFAEEPVWNTFLRLEFQRWGFLTPGWVPFETLIVLIPAREADEAQSDPGGDPGDDPGGDPGGGDQPRYPDQPGGEPGDDPGGDPRFPSNFDDGGVCCLPDGSCDSTISADYCERLGGTFTIGGTCATVECPQSSGDPCAAVEGEITDICYTYEQGVLKVYASYAIHNKGSVAAKDITAYALVGLNDGVNGLGGGPECQDWKYGIDIPAGGTYTYDVVFSTTAPNLNLANLSYLYGMLWLQAEAPWDCWPIIKQDFVQTWDPAPLCSPQGSDDQGTPPGGRNDGEPGGTPPGDYDIVGACCLPDGSCDSLDEAECLRRDGLFYGPGTDCADIRCLPAEEPPCAIIRSRVTNACHLYQGPDRPMIVKADFNLQNPGDKDALSVEVKLVAGVPLLANLQTTYNDTYVFTIPIIPAGGSHQFSHTFSIDPAPPQQPTGDTVVMVFAASRSPLCKLKINSLMDLFHLLYFGPTENICPDDGGTPPGGSDDGGSGTPPPGGDDEEPFGACCLPSGQCIETGITDCDTQGGEFRGEGSSCEGSNCPSGSSEGACPSISAYVDEACYEYTGPNQPLIVRATFGVQNFGTATAQSPWMELTATCDITVNGITTTYEDTTSFYGADIPPNGEITGTHEFNLGAVPQAPDSYVLVHLLSRITSPCPDYTETTGTNASDIACSGSSSTGEPGEPDDPTEPGEPDPDPETGTGALPNLWVTGMTGCWTWSNDGREHIVATVTGVVHNGGQADASNVYARVYAGAKSAIVSAGFIPAGGQKTVSATIDVGPYMGSESFPVPTSIEADPLDAITEADESNNKTSSSFPESCN